MFLTLESPLAIPGTEDFGLEDLDDTGIFALGLMISLKIYEGERVTFYSNTSLSTNYSNIQRVKGSLL